jgi:FkbM family methyltransferase
LLRPVLRRTWLNLARYSSVVGWVRGAWFVILELVDSKPRVVTIRVRGIAAPLEVRLRTSDLAVVAQVFVDGEYDTDYGIEPEFIVDAGANIGASPIYYANRFPGARVVAIEPDPANYAILRSNVSRWPQITPVHAALWPEDAMVELSDHGYGTWGYQATVSQDGTIPAMSMDWLLESTGLERVDLLKIDIEGAERDLFDAAGDWIHRVRAIVIELHDQQTPGCDEAFTKATRDFQVRSTHGEHVIVRRTLESSDVAAEG